jgi:hypothetical protein
MAIKYLLPAALLGSNADDDYLRTVLKYGDTTQYTSHVRAAFDYGVKATFRTNGTRSTLEKELDVKTVIVLTSDYPIYEGLMVNTSP